MASRIRVVRRRSKHIDEEVVAIGVALSKGLIEAKKDARGNKRQSSSLTTRRQQSAHVVETVPNRKTESDRSGRAWFQ